MHCSNAGQRNDSDDNHHGSSANSSDDEDDTSDCCQNDEETVSEFKKCQVYSLAQDVVYTVSNGKVWTPKHVGLACAIHKETRSKQLINLLHKADVCISYREVLQILTGIAEETLKTVDNTDGSVMPPNLVPNRFIHFTMDNIDINEGIYFRW